MDVFGGAYFHPSEVLRRSACPLPCPPGTRWLRQEEGKGLGWGGTPGNPTCHMYLPPNFWFGLVIWWFDLVVSPLLPARNRGSREHTSLAPPKGIPHKKGRRTCLSNSWYASKQQTPPTKQDSKNSEIGKWAVLNEEYPTMPLVDIGAECSTCGRRASLKTDSTRRI